MATGENAVTLPSMAAQQRAAEWRAAPTIWLADPVLVPDSEEEDYCWLSNTRYRPLRNRSNPRCMPRIHILGASGSGTSTLGAALSRRLGVPHVDADTLYWAPTDPRFTTPRPAAERQALLLHRLPVTGHWVFSGAVTEWAAPLEPYYDVVVFLRLDPALRLARLRQRETSRYGPRILPGGDMAGINALFMAVAEAYDSAGPSSRGLAAHEAWLIDQPAPVIRLDSSAPVKHLVAAVLDRSGLL